MNLIRNVKVRVLFIRSSSLKLNGKNVEIIISGYEQLSECYPQSHYESLFITSDAYMHIVLQSIIESPWEGRLLQRSIDHFEEITVLAE